MGALTKDEVKTRLRQLEGWELDDDELERKYKFADFAAAMVFVNRVAGLAEEADHHPDISIKYNQVKLTLSTHSEGGITEKDFDLAAKIDATGS
jgi:4a-hydroxytetrahydrobiopterin dehydratase